MLIEKRGQSRIHLAHKFYARIAVRLAAVPASTPRSHPSIRSSSTATLRGAGRAEPDGRDEGREVTVKASIWSCSAASCRPRTGRRSTTRRSPKSSRQRAAKPRSARRSCRKARCSCGRMAGARGQARRSRWRRIRPCWRRSSGETGRDRRGGGRPASKGQAGARRDARPLLQRMGADAWQAREWSTSSRAVDARAAIRRPRSRIDHGALADRRQQAGADACSPSSARRGRKVTVGRTAAGEFVASETRSRPSGADLERASRWRRKPLCEPLSRGAGAEHSARCDRADPEDPCL